MPVLAQQQGLAGDGQDSKCWRSFNAALNAVEQGDANVFWQRGSPQAFCACSRLELATVVMKGIKGPCRYIGKSASARDMPTWQAVGSEVTAITPSYFDVFCHQIYNKYNKFDNLLYLLNNCTNSSSNNCRSSGEQKLPVSTPEDAASHCMVG